MRKSIVLAAMNLAALLSVGVTNRFASHAWERKLAPALPTRSWSTTKGGKRKTIYPAQTKAAAAQAKEAAQAKRDRKGAILTRNAERSAQGYHPDAKWSAMHKAA